MAVTTWQGDDGSSPTDWGTAANWDTGSVPDGTSDVVIPDCSSIGNCILDGDTTINSLQIQGNGNFSMNNHDLTIDGENGSGRAIDIGNNTVTFVGGTGTLIFTLGSGATNLVGIEHLAASTELRNLQFNGAATFVLGGAMTVNGNLTITAGTLSTSGDNNYALTVTGSTQVTGTLTCNASAVSLGSGITSGWGLEVVSGGTFNGGTGDHTYGSVYFKTGSTATSTSGDVTVNSKESGDYSVAIHAGCDWDNASSEWTLTGDSSNFYCKGDDSSGIYDLIINSSGKTFTSYSYIYVENDFTITAGTVDTGSDYILTVDGDVSVTGTLTGNASAISLGSLTIESGGTYSATSGTTTITSFINDKSIVNNSGTFTNNDGTVVIDVTNSNKTMVDARATYHNLTINSDGSNKEVELNNQAATIEGNLTVQEGKLFTYATSGRHLTVTGDVSIEDGGEIDMNNAAGKNATFGSLTIASGGEYSATSGTTTITKNTGTTGVTGRAFYVHTSGTFTHNNGLMKFTSADADTQVTGQSVSKNPFYDLETTSTYEPKEANETAVLNNATFANNVTFQDSARYIKVLGICRFVSGEYNRNNNSTNANHYFGTLIIEGGVFELSPMEITVGSLRKLGGTIS